MPVRCRSRASICAMYCLPFWLRSRSSSRSALKPARMVPPSARFSGGSSEIASRIRLATSGSSSRPFVQRAQPRSLLRVEAPLQRRNLFERAAQRQQIARTGRAERDLGEQAFQIENAGQLFAQFGAQNGLLQQFSHGIEALLDFGAVHGRPQQALTQQAAAHAGQRSGRARSARWPAVACRRVGGEDRFDQFQIAHRDGVEDHGIGAIVVRPAGRDGRARRVAFRAGSGESRPPRPPPPAGWPGRSHRARAA